MRNRTGRAVLGAALLALSTVSCDVHGVSDAGDLSTLSVSPDPTTLAINGTRQFTAAGADFSGASVAVNPTWTVVSGGGSISSSGVFTAGTAVGTFASTVRASSNGRTATATVVVTAGPLASIVLTPTPVSLAAGGTQQYTAVGRDVAGNAVAITPSWSVIAGGGSVGASGLFTAGTTAGTFANTVQVSSGGIAATATVNVTAGALATMVLTPSPTTLAPGGTQQFTVVGRDANGNVVAVTPAWSVTAGGGSVDATGLFTAGASSGTFANTVRATSGTIVATATVTVTAGTLATITVTPNPANLAPGAVQQFTAVGRDAAGNVVALTPTWSVVAGGGSIASDGRFTAGNTAGTFANTVQAGSGGIVGSATVNVTTGSLTTIVVTPNPATLSPGNVQQFTATGRDANGNTVAITPVWSVTNGGGSIATDGRFTAGNTAGTFTNTVRATSGTISGSATVDVVAGAVATIVVSPNPEILGVGEQRQFSAVGRDANGNVVTIAPTWAVVNGGGTIGQTSGLFTAGNTTGTFNNTVRASVGTVAGFATVTVTAAPVIPPPTNLLGSAASNGIMAGTAVTCVIGGTIFADVSISPGNTITGFPPCAITGVQNLGNALAAQMQIDLTTAYNTLAGMPCPPANFISANLGGTTKTAGVYCSATSIGVTGTLTLDGGGDPNAMFVFQAGSGLTTAGNIVLINGAMARNVYWQVGSSATIGTASQWQGNIVALTSITLVDNANLFGRALARNGAVSLGTGNTITLP
jgi:hypothetical protein